MKAENDRVEFYPTHIEGLPHIPYQTLSNKRWGWVVEVDYKGYCIQGFSKLNPGRARINAVRTIANLKKMPPLTDEHRLRWLSRQL